LGLGLYETAAPRNRAVRAPGSDHAPKR
jgi:hypothetical protein